MKYSSKLVASIQPYTAGEQLNDKKYVKLNTNENPYPPSSAVEETLKKIQIEKLRLYPQPNADILREAIGKAEGVNKENIFCGNGSDEVLALCFPAFFDSDGKGACFADITYSFYPVFANFFKIPKKIVPVKKDYSFDLKQFSITDCQGYFLTNPNAPTGLGFSKKEMEEFLKNTSDKIVIADEAYMDFYGESCVSLTKQYKNLLVVKTFSKSYSLAGIRCGYAVGNKELINCLFKVKDCFNSYPIDYVCQNICATAVVDKSYYSKVTQQVVSERERVRQELLALGFYVTESKANFLFAGNFKTGGKYIYEKLKENGVLVRYWNTEKLKDFCRITIGTKEQNDILLDVLKKIL